MWMAPGYVPDTCPRNSLMRFLYFVVKPCLFPKAENAVTLMMWGWG